MQIANNSVVSFDYTLKDPEGNLIDSSEGGEPLAYIQGLGHIIPGLEAVMEGKKVGDQFDVTIPPEKAYGTYNEELVQTIPKAHFEEGVNIVPGMQFSAEREGQYYTITVLEVQNENVVVDGNHPLAGMELSFNVNIKEVRAATEEELSHGHVHGPNGHHHH
ncbi:MAG: peptidylprolyl isomerase [Leptospiraceae bacterium]|nr:peptidylprolyl isomerase [Leptospiraceae bacterium]